MIDYEKIADTANMIINGYAFTKDGENIRILNLNNPEMAIVLELSRNVYEMVSVQ